jgi:hypothetical protein
MALLLLLLLVFLIPLTVYCLILAVLNRRLNPAMVSGLWDCVGLLFGLSGFFLAVVPGLLTVLYQRTMWQQPIESGKDSSAALAEVWADFWLIFLLYYVVVLFVAGFLLWYRSNKTVIYNVDPADFQTVFTDLLTHMGLGQTRSGPNLIIGPGLQPEQTLVISSDTVASGPPPPARMPPELNQTAVLRVESFAALCHVTLHWQGASPEFREAMESELRRALRDVETPPHPAASWLMAIAGSLLGLILLICLVIILVVFFPLHR